MKTSYFILLIFITFTPLLHAGDSRRTAEYILATPVDFEGKEVMLDVAFVKPVQWKSPAPELAFFRAMTLDRRDHKPGGHILIAVLSADAGKTAKKYGMDFTGHNDTTPLRGILIAIPSRGMQNHVWLIDTTGKAADLIKAKKLEINDDGVGVGPDMFRRPGTPELRRPRS